MKHWSRLVSFGVVSLLFASFAVADGSRDDDEKDDSMHVIDVSVINSDDSVHENTQIVHLGDQNVLLEIAPGAVEVSVVVPESGVEVTTGAQTVNFGGTKITQAAQTAIAGYGNTTGSCFRTYGLGGSTRGGSWSVGWPVLDKDCRMGEDAAQAFIMGNPVIGWKLFCHQPGVKGVYGAKRFRRGTTHEDAVTACLNDAGIAAMLTEANEQRDELSEKLDAMQATLEKTVTAQTDGVQLAALIDERIVKLEEVKPPEPRIVYQSVVATEPAPDPVDCPPLEWPAGVNAVLCDGVAHLNPSREIPLASPGPG